MKYVYIKEEKKLTVARMFNVDSCKVTYHLPRNSEKGFERFKEKYVAIEIHHPLLMQHEIFGY